jgi:transcriptional regulator with XRE-family HTH domain
MPTKTKAFGRALKKLDSKKLTQEDLSLEAQLARVYISELEYGKKTPSIETVFKLSRALNVRCSKLMDLTEEEFIR